MICRSRNVPSGIMEMTAQSNSEYGRDRQAGALEAKEALPSLEDLGVTPEMVEAALEISDCSDVL